MLFVYISLMLVVLIEIWKQNEYPEVLRIEYPVIVEKILLSVNDF